MICPNCNGENVTIELVQTGTTTKKHGNGLGGIVNNTARAVTAVGTLGMSNLVWKKAKGTEKETAINQKVCLCQSCGHSWALDDGKKGRFKK